MAKKTLIRAAAAFGISGVLQLLSWPGQLEYPDRLFFLGLICLIICGSVLLSANGYFLFQRYAFRRVASRLPMLSRLLMTPGSVSPEDETEAPDTEDAATKEKDGAFMEDFHEYKKKHAPLSQSKDALPWLFSFMLLGSVSLLIDWLGSF